MKTVMDLSKRSGTRSWDQRSMVHAIKKTKLSEMITTHPASFVGEVNIDGKNYALLSQYTHTPPINRQYYFDIAKKKFDLEEKELFVKIDKSHLCTVLVAVDPANIPTLINMKGIEVKEPEIGKCVDQLENHYINKSNCIAVDLNQQPFKIKSDDVQWINKNNGEKLAEFYNQNRPPGSLIEYHYNAEKNQFETREVKIPTVAPVDPWDF